jgi:hypothetical protein
VIGQLYYCPQCSIVYLKFPDTVISAEGEPKQTLSDRVGYLLCPHCISNFIPEQVELRPIASPSHILVKK